MSDVELKNASSKLLRYALKQKLNGMNQQARARGLSEVPAARAQPQIVFDTEPTTPVK